MKLAIETAWAKELTRIELTVRSDNLNAITLYQRFGFQVEFNSNSIEFVDRVMVLRMNTEEMQIEVLLDAPIAEILPLLSEPSAGKRTLALSKLVSKAIPVRESGVANEVIFEDYVVRELESGTIQLERGGAVVLPVKPALRELAVQLNLGLLNSRGNEFNTRQLGTQIIRSIRALRNQPSPGVVALAEEE
jgi:hypothetical protein